MHYCCYIPTIQKYIHFEIKQVTNILILRKAVRLQHLRAMANVHTMPPQSRLYEAFLIPPLDVVFTRSNAKKYNNIQYLNLEDTSVVLSIKAVSGFRFIKKQNSGFVSKPVSYSPFKESWSKTFLIEVQKLEQILY